MPKPVSALDVFDIGDYEVVCRPRVSILGNYAADLRIRRKTDRKLIYPHDGCRVPGVFDAPKDGRVAALELAHEVIRLDIEYPET